VHEAEGGCYADWFSVFGDATSPDNSVELQIAPQFTWQCPGSPTAINLSAIHRINPLRHPDSDFHRISARGIEDPGYQVVVPAAR
jgi:hypothetical protein